MKKRVILLSLAAFAAASGALAHDKDKDKVIKVERKKTCVCSFDGTGGPEGYLVPSPPPPPPPPGAPVPPHGAATWEMQLPDGDVKVYRHRSGGPGEERMFVYKIRTREDDADTNRDGKITRKEFEKEAQRRFKELDRNNNGVLERDEARPPLPPLPPMPPMPAAPAAPPAPPVPPVPPMPDDED